jgi:hypothetical protein
MGLREVSSNVAAFLATLGVMSILDRVPFPWTYTVLFVLFFVFFFIGFLFLTRLKEAEYPGTLHQSPAAHLKSVFQLPAKDRVFKWFVVFLFHGSITLMWMFELFAALSFAPPDKRHLYIAYTSLVKIIPVTLYTNLGESSPNMSRPSDHLSYPLCSVSPR